MIPTLVVSLMLLVLFTWNLLRAFQAWRHYSDVRSLRFMVQAVMLFASAIGLSLGALALRDPNQVNAVDAMRFAIGFMRSVLLIGGIYLLVSWRRR